MHDKFIVQKYELPQVYHHVGIVRQIGEPIGDLDETSLSGKEVMSEQFLRFRVLQVEQPLPASFFMELGEGNKA